jgi:hypothetical protein
LAGDVLYAGAGFCRRQRSFPISVNQKTGHSNIRVSVRAMVLSRRVLWLGHCGQRQFEEAAKFICAGLLIESR